MCGICGFYTSNNSLHENDLRSMNKLLKHRGPNADGLYFDGIIGLGHTRLSILDLSESANQPMYSSCGNYIVVFNGEVYNFKELAKKYKLSLKTTSDTEVILELFALKGKEVINEFNGMFAIAIWDRNSQKLFICRDRMGVKPLFYYWDGNNFIFASELKSISNILDNCEINFQAAEYFLHLGYIPHPLTIFKNIYKFPSANFLEFENSSFHFSPFWKLEDQIEDKVISNLGEAKNSLKALLESSVDYRLVSDVPFGTFLSGGTDSSLITAIAKNKHSQKLSTFSIGFKESKYNELPFANEIAKYLGTNHHEFVVTEQDAMDLIEDGLDIFDEPFSDSSFLPTLMVSKLARKEVTMILSGDGGDELFLGYGSYKWAERLNNPFLKYSKGLIGGVFGFSDKESHWKAQNMFSFHSNDYLPSHIFSQEQYLFSNIELQNLSLQKMDNSLFSKRNSIASRKLLPMEEQALFDLKYYLNDDLLVKVDRTSMFHSLEVRVPFLDYRVVKFALNLNKDLKFRNGIQKYILKEVLYDYIPKHFFNRPKWGFSMPLREWLKKDLKYLVDQYACEEVIREFNILDYNQVAELIKKFKGGHDYLYNKIWVIVILHRWLKKHAGKKVTI